MWARSGVVSRSVGYGYGVKNPRIHRPTSPVAPTAHTTRFGMVDALRGVAVLWMTLYHFAYDLSHFGYWPQDFRADPVWTWQRTAIVSMFLFCAGLGQAIAVHQGQSWQRFWRRWAQVAGCAVLVSVASYGMFPRSFIYFGVLHGMAVMLIIARLTAGWGVWLWPLGALAIASKFAAQALLGTGEVANVFNAIPLNILGWVTRNPFTEDYVPLFPWLGVVWWGLAAGQWLLRTHPQALSRPLPRFAAIPAWLGRWSLSWYMLHQPVLMGMLMAVGWVMGR